MKYCFYVMGILFLTVIACLLLVSNNAYVSWVISKSTSIEEILKGYSQWYMGVTWVLLLCYGAVIALYGWIVFCMFRDYKKAKMIIFPTFYDYAIWLAIVSLFLISVIILPCSKNAKRLSRDYRADYEEIRNGTLNKAEGSILIVQDEVSLKTLSKSSKIYAFSSCQVGRNGIKLVAPDFYLEKFARAEKDGKTYLEDGKKFEVYYTSHFKVIVTLE